MIGFYNASVILTYLGVVSAVFGMSQAFNGNFKIAILCLMISGLTDMYDGTIAKMIKRAKMPRSLESRLILYVILSVLECIRL